MVEENTYILQCKIVHTELFEFMKLRNVSNVQKRHYPLLQGNLSNIVSISEWTGGWAEMQQLRRPSLWPGRAGAGQGHGGPDTRQGRTGQALSYSSPPLKREMANKWIWATWLSPPSPPAVTCCNALSLRPYILLQLNEQYKSQYRYIWAINH